MSISLTIGNNTPISINGLTDLENISASTALQLGKEFAADLNTALAALPANFQATNVSYSSGNQTWSPAGPVSFSLSGGVSGKISVLSSGNLFSYTDGFPITLTSGLGTSINANSTVNVPVPNGAFYLCLELDFNLNGSFTGSYTNGAFGLTANTSGGATTSVAFYRKCDPTMTLLAAVEDAFQGFVLPLHAKTLSNLRAGDYLHYDFNANLQLGLGATAGFDKVFYAGLYKSQVPNTAGAIAGTVSVKPEVQAGAKLSFAYSYAGSFEVLLWKDVADATLANLHLYRSSQQDTSLGLNLGLTVTSGASASAAVTTTQVTNALTQFVPSALQPAFTSSVLTPATTEIQKLINDANAKITSLLSPLNGQKSSLDLAVDRSFDRFLLTDFTIDTTQNYAAAWSDILAGRYVDAFETPGSGVSLKVGSGLETIYNKTTSIKLNLFGKLTAQWDASTITNSSLVYAGNSTFHLLTDTGKELLRLINGSSREVQFYFAAEAALSAGQVVTPDINLHVLLQATNDRSFGGYIANIVGMLTSGATGQTLKNSVQASAAQNNSTQILHLIFKQSDYSSLNSSTLTKGKPDNEGPDTINFNAFKAACGQLFPPSDSPYNFTFQGTSIDYGFWRNTNIAQNDQWPPSANSVPNRLETGPYSAADSYLSQMFPSAGAQTTEVYVVCEIASEFMNLCESLKNLCGAVADTDLTNWEGLVDQLSEIVKKDVDRDFIAPTALALTQLCGGPPPTVSGPAAGVSNGSSIAITMQY